LLDVILPGTYVPRKKKKSTATAPKPKPAAKKEIED